MKIELKYLQTQSAISKPAVYSYFLFIPWLSLSVLTLNIDDSGPELHDWIQYNVQAIPFLILPILPVIILRNRNKKLRERELTKVNVALFDDEPNSESIILSNHSDDLNKTDLIVRQIWLENLTLWPIASYVPKLLSWGLLIPLSLLVNVGIEYFF